MILRALPGEWEGRILMPFIDEAGELRRLRMICIRRLDGQKPAAGGWQALKTCV